MAQRARPVAAGAAHQQGLVHGRDRRDTEVGLRQRVRRRVHPGHGEVPGTVRRPVQHTIRKNQLEHVRFACKKKPTDSRARFLTYRRVEIPELESISSSARNPQ